MAYTADNLADLRRRAVTFADRAALGLSRARKVESRNSKRRAAEAAFEATCLVAEAERLTGDVAEMFSGVSFFFSGDFEAAVAANPNSLGRRLADIERCVEAAERLFRRWPKLSRVSL